MSDTPVTSIDQVTVTTLSAISTPASSVPVSDAITQAETAVNTQGVKVLGEFEADMIEFIQSSVRHAAEALPLLTGELGDGLSELLAKARTLASKHGFALRT